MPSAHVPVLNSCSVPDLNIVGIAEQGSEVFPLKTASLRAESSRTATLLPTLGVLAADHIKLSRWSAKVIDGCDIMISRGK